MFIGYRRLRLHPKNTQPFDHFEALSKIATKKDRFSKIRWHSSAFRDALDNEDTFPNFLLTSNIDELLTSVWRCLGGRLFVFSTMISVSQKASSTILNALPLRCLKLMTRQLQAHVESAIY